MLTTIEKVQISRARDEHKARAEDTRAKAAIMAKAVTDATGPAPIDHPYLARKGVRPHLINIQGADLLIPVRDIDGNDMSYQTIAPNGDKLFMKGGKKYGGMFPLGTAIGNVIYVCEGFATAASVREATNEYTVVAFDAGNLPPVVEALRVHGKQIVICADNDKSGIGLKMAESARPDKIVIPPDLGDFNDLHQAKGLMAVYDVVGIGPRSIKYTPLGVLDYASIPPRPWLFGDQLLLGYVTSFVAPPGVGKSTLTIQFGLAVAMGVEYAGFKAYQQGNVWIYNNEDDRDELNRRIAAAATVMGIDAAHIQDRVGVDTGDERALLVARSDRNGNVTQTPDVEACIAEIKANGVKLFIVDPFTETHTVNENSNDEIKQVAAMYRRIAKEADCSVLLVHHTRKGGEAGDQDGARGASAFNAVARVVSTIFNMSPLDAGLYGIADDERHLYVRFDNAKANLSLATNQAKWFKRESILLPNGDWVGALMPWEPPDVFDGVTLKDLIAVQRQVNEAVEDGRPFGPTSRSADNWVGTVIANQLNLDAKHDRKRIAAIFKDWCENDMFRVEKMRNEDHQMRDAVLVGTWATAE